MALLTKDDVPRIRENLRTCADFLRSVRFVLDVNSSEFYTKGAWRDHVVPALCPRDVIGAAREFVASAGVIRENYDHTWGIDVHQQKLVNVNLFLRAAAHHTLAGLGFLLSTQDIFHLFQSSVHTEFQEPSLMCDKKCHEVALLSRLVVALVQHCSLNQVIDIGSGKGYLSSHLSECYGLKVIGIDASNTVTCGAHDRTQKLQKFLSRRQKARCKTGTVPPIVIGESIDNETSGMKIEVGTNTIDTEGESDIHWTTESAVFTGEGCNSVERINTEKMIDTPILMSKNIERVFPETTQTGRPLQPNERQNTDGVQVNVNMEQHFANGLNTSCSSTTISSCEAQRMNNQELVAATERTTNLAGLFSPVTLQLTHKTNLEQLFPALEDSVLVGLHTCGNLGSNILRVFLCHKQLRALSNVGCCYHLLTETSPLGADAEDPCGFPMSQFLLKSGFMLGRNMKMTACLAPERAARGKGLPNESLFRWAVLQVIIRDRFKHVSTTQHIGKVCNKTASFLGYCRKAFVLLGLDDSQISDDDITAYHDSYAPRAHELEAFNMLKAALSPCVEAIIFLDRLSFLLEQDLSCHAALVSLFDPAKSPRHYAIVAVKDKQRRATS